MKVHGTVRLDASRADVFGAIRDPAALLAIIPGCEAVEQVGPAEYRAMIVLRLPGLVDRYRTIVRLVDVVPPERVGLQGRVEGAHGSIVGEACLTLAEEGGGTVLDYRGEAAVDGPLARLDSRFAEGFAGSLIAQGLRALDRRLAREPSAAATAGGPRPGTEVSE